MAPTPFVSSVIVEGYVFPPALKPPGSANTLFLAGAGVRGLEIQGKFVKFTAIAVYLEDNAVPTLATNWNGKNVDGLADSVDFFRGIVTGPFEKLTRVKMIMPLSGSQYTVKVAENITAYWKSIGSYTEAEEKAVEEFHQAFKDRIFQPGASIFFAQSKLGSLSIRFSNDELMPESPAAVIHNRALSEAILESIIGKHGVSPSARQSIATRMAELMKKIKKADEVVVAAIAPVSAKPAIAVADCNGKSVEV